MTTTAEILTRRLTDVGWDEADLGRAAGLPTSTVRRYVLGESEPSAVRFRELLDHLGARVVTVDHDPVEWARVRRIVDRAATAAELEGAPFDRDEAAETLYARRLAVAR